MKSKYEFKLIPLGDLEVVDYNPNEMNKTQMDHLRKTIKERGFMQPLTITHKEGVPGKFIVMDGAHRLEIFKELKRPTIPCYIVPDKKPIDIKIDLINLNKIKGEFNQKKYAQLIVDLQSELDRDQIKELINMDLAEQEAYEALLKQEEFKVAGLGAHGTLSIDYIVPPFSVLDARKGEWLKRKKQWLDILETEELGRSRDGLLKMSKTSVMIKKGKKPVTLNFSLFDPVLAEICLLWYCPKNGIVFDPFAGDVSQSIVAAIKGYNFKGIELRPEQIEIHMHIANRLNTKDNVLFYCDDAINLDKHIKPESVDFLFSCPPYYDLEKYSDEPGDMSNMTEEDFDKKMAEIIIKSAKTLKNNHFACFVVGEVRRKSGIGQYKSLVPKMIKWCEDASLHYYNELILVTPVGSLPIRVRKVWEASRKIGKTHQNVLVFYKGDGKEMKGLVESIGIQDLKEAIKEEKEAESDEQERAE